MLGKVRKSPTGGIGAFQTTEVRVFQTGEVREFQKVKLEHFKRNGSPKITVANAGVKSDLFSPLDLRVGKYKFGFK